MDEEGRWMEGDGGGWREMEEDGERMERGWRRIEEDGGGWRSKDDRKHHQRDLCMVTWTSSHLQTWARPVETGRSVSEGPGGGRGRGRGFIR